MMDLILMDGWMDRSWRGPGDGHDALSRRTMKKKRARTHGTGTGHYSALSTGVFYFQCQPLDGSDQIIKTTTCL